MINVILSFIIFILSYSLLYGGDDKKGSSPTELLELDKIIEKKTRSDKLNNKSNSKTVAITHGYIKSEDLNSEIGDKKSSFDISIADPRKLLYEDKILLDAITCYQIGHIEIAVQLYKQVLSKSPNNYNALFGLASIYQQEKRIDETRSLYTKIINSYPNDESTLNNFIELFGEESPEKTIEELKKLEASKPDVSSIPAQIAKIYNNMKNYNKALEYFSKALTLSPENLNYRYNLAIVYDQIGAYDKAMYLYNQIMNTNITNEDYEINYDQIAKRIKYLYSN